jgi:hypothetical protein
VVAIINHNVHRAMSYPKALQSLGILRAPQQ